MSSTRPTSKPWRLESKASRSSRGLQLPAAAAAAGEPSVRSGSQVGEYAPTINGGGGSSVNVAGWLRRRDQMLLQEEETIIQQRRRRRRGFDGIQDIIAVINSFVLPMQAARHRLVSTSWDAAICYMPTFAPHVELIMKREAEEGVDTFDNNYVDGRVVKPYLITHIIASVTVLGSAALAGHLGRNSADAFLNLGCAVTVEGVVFGIALFTTLNLWGNKVQTLPRHTVAIAKQNIIRWLLVDLVASMPLCAAIAFAPTIGIIMAVVASVAGLILCYLTVYYFWFMMPYDAVPRIDEFRSRLKAIEAVDRISRVEAALARLEALVLQYLNGRFGVLDWST